MNWKLIFLLSMMALAMGIVTISIVPSDTEKMIWPVVIIISALAIGRFAPGKYFMHGLFLGLVNCLWVTSCHIIMSDTYILNHPEEMKQFGSMFGDLAIKGKMAIMGIFIGLGSGIVIGLLGWLSSIFLKKKPAQVA